MTATENTQSAAAEFGTSHADGMDDLDYITGKVVKVNHVGHLGIVQSAYRIGGDVTVDVRVPLTGIVHTDLEAFGPHADISQTTPALAYATYRNDWTDTARWATSPECDSCGRYGRPCARWCPDIHRIYSTR